ncbi:MAG TPA: LemA family protein [Patescibacteria group bacterium]
MIYVIIVLVILALWAIGAYNSLVKHRVRAEEAWSDIDVQLKRRYDLIPNLVETVKAYAKHEKELFTQVAEARSQAIHAKTPAARATADTMMTETLKTLFAVSESYPELKASDNFKELQRELSDTENKVEAARRFYNSNVRDLNIALDTFPTNIIGGMFHIAKKDLFEAVEGERETPKVSFEDDASSKKSAQDES